MRDKDFYEVPCISAMRLIIPTSFEECLTYGQRQLYMWQCIQELQERVAELEQQVEDLTPAPL